ncbi:glycine--tRNA ligase [bacterium]|nr:MAG: glycine--tRNA ligase [bacterium]
MPARSLDQIVSLSKRRGFVFPGSAAYGGLGSFWDYGPLGAELMRNVKDAWWKAMTWERDDIEGVDCAILMNRKVWQHSGHEATFSDPLVDCKSCKARHRADHLFSTTTLFESPENLDKALDFCPPFTQKIGKELVRKSMDHNAKLAAFFDERLQQLGETDPGFPPEKYKERVIEEAKQKFGDIGQELKDFVNSTFVLLFVAVFKAKLVKCPKCGSSDVTEMRQFNLMFQTHVGPVSTAPGTEEELASRVYLRPETAQGIFMNFKNVLDSSRRKLPFGIAQIGKAFRNEITPGNFTFRTREFEQMELEFFIKPPQFLREGEKTDEQWHAEWVDARYRWWISLGIDTSRLRKRAQDKSELAHYAKATTDLEYLFPGSLGWGEVEGVANRTDFDLSAHSREVPEADLKRLKLEPNKDSVTTLDYFDSDLKQRYIPWVIEPSAGATRAALTFLCEAYHEEMVKEPPQAEIDALKTEIDAVIKNAEKKKKDAEKEKDPAQRKHDPVAISAFQAALAEAASRLPASLMEIDTLLEDHPGAQNLEPVKKLKPKVNKLAEDCVRVVLKLHPKLAPVKVAVFPLARNKPELVDIAQRVSRELRHFCKAIYDDSAGIGKLYRRQDEIGTPLCVTVDHQTLEDNMVTVRDRDTMDQVRISLEQLPHEIRRRLQLH